MDGQHPFPKHRNAASLMQATRTRVVHVFDSLVLKPIIMLLPARIQGSSSRDWNLTFAGITLFTHSVSIVRNHILSLLPASNQGVIPASL